MGAAAAAVAGDGVAAAPAAAAVSTSADGTLDEEGAQEGEDIAAWAYVALMTNEIM